MASCFACGKSQRSAGGTGYWVKESFSGAYDAVKTGRMKLAPHKRLYLALLAYRKRHGRLSPYAGNILLCPDCRQKLFAMPRLGLGL